LKEARKWEEVGKEEDEDGGGVRTPTSWHRFGLKSLLSGWLGRRDAAQ
jgi:hypothetical protein